MKKFSFSKLGWGIFALAIAALILVNHFGGFVELGFWSILGSAVALAAIVINLVKLSLAGLPIPLALLYYIFQIPFGLPFIGFWTLAAVSIIASIGLSILLPKSGWIKFAKNTGANGDDGWDDDWDDWDDEDDWDEGNVVVNINNEDGHVVIHDEDGNVTVNVGNDQKKQRHKRSNNVNSENNPKVSVSFGENSRYLHATALKTARLNCKFGSLSVYFDQAQLHPDGADVFVDCSFGATELYVPRHWNIINNTSCTLGAAEIDNNRSDTVSNPPTLTIHGNVSFGALEVNRTGR